MKWFIGVIVLLLAALLLESGLLAYAMYVLLAVMVVSRFLARNWIGRLHAGRRCEQLTAEIGETIDVDVTVTNSGWLPVPWVLLEDMLPIRSQMHGAERLGVRGKRMKLAMIGARSEAKLRYGLRPRTRGYFQVGPLVMETGDLFGLHRRYRVATEPHFLLVYPKVIPLEGYELASRRPIGEVRLSLRLYEDPTRIAGVRGYQPGDPINRVHWRATARTGALHCKVYEPSSVAGATILLDFHFAGYPGRGEPWRSELAVTVAASLANAVDTLGQQVGLVTNGVDAAERVRIQGWQHDFRSRVEARKSAGGDEEEARPRALVVPTRRSTDQFQRIRELLARVEMAEEMTLADLVEQGSGAFPRDATVVAILPDVPVASALALGALRRVGYALSVVLVMLDEAHLETAYGRLAAEGILEVRHLRSEAAVPTLCRQQVQGEWAAPYHAEVTLAD